MRTLPAALLLILLATDAGAATLDAVRRSLAELPGRVPVSARLVSADSRTDGNEKGESRGTSVAEDDGTHIRLVHEKQGLVRRDDNKRGADHSVTAAEAAELLNFAPALLRMLEGATVRKSTPTTVNGRPATLLELGLQRKKDRDGDKWVKSYEDVLLLWLDGNGLPVAARRTRHIKARVVVVGFELNEKDDLQFQRGSDRLLVTRRTTESSGSGLGQSEKGKKTITLTVNG